MSEPDTSRETGIAAESQSATNTDFSPSVINLPIYMDNGTVEMISQWTQDQIKILLDLSVDQVQLHFEDILGLKKHQTCLKEAALLDYFVAGFWWAKGMRFTFQQISFVMALLQLLLDNMKDKQMPFAENFTAFTQKLLATRKSSVETDINPLFDVDQMKSIMNFFKSRLHKVYAYLERADTVRLLELSSSWLKHHYRLYQFLFTHPRDEALLEMERSIEVVNSDDFAAPLEEGMPTEEYFHHMACAPATSPPQVLEECLEKKEEESAESQQREGQENLEGFCVEDVSEVLEEVTKEMLAELQAEFIEKLRIQEESYTSRLDCLKRVASK